MDKTQLKNFILAGNATFTALNPATGRRFTFKISSPKNANESNPVRFVSLLTGPDNQNDFEYLGTVFNGDTFRYGKKSRIGHAALSARAFGWLFPRIVAEAELGGAEVHHEGRCGRCGRPLTVPESLETGLGPTCSKAG